MRIHLCGLFDGPSHWPTVGGPCGHWTSSLTEETRYKSTICRNKDGTITLHAATAAFFPPISTGSTPLGRSRLYLATSYLSAHSAHPLPPRLPPASYHARRRSRYSLLVPRRCSLRHHCCVAAPAQRWGGHLERHVVSCDSLSAVAGGAFVALRLAFLLRPLQVYVGVTCRQRVHVPSSYVCMRTFGCRDASVGMNQSRCIVLIEVLCFAVCAMHSVLCLRACSCSVCSRHSELRTTHHFHQPYSTQLHHCKAASNKSAGRPHIHQFNLHLVLSISKNIHAPISSTRYTASVCISPSRSRTLCI